MWSRKLLLTIDAYIIDPEVVGENEDDVRAFGSEGRCRAKRRRRTGGKRKPYEISARDQYQCVDLCGRNSVWG